jgi:hypothetical protein
LQPADLGRGLGSDALAFREQLPLERSQSQALGRQPFDLLLEACVGSHAPMIGLRGATDAAPGVSALDHRQGTAYEQPANDDCRQPARDHEQDQRDPVHSGPP